MTSLHNSRSHPGEARHLAAVIGMVAAMSIPAAVAQEGLSREEFLAQQNQNLELVTGPLRLQPDYPQSVVEQMTKTLGDSAVPMPVASIVELDAPLTPEMRTELEAVGIMIEEYLGGTTYLVAIMPTTETLALSSTLDTLVTAGAPLTPEAKVRPAALEPFETTGALDAEAEAVTPTLSVEFLSVVEPQQARAQLEQMGFTVANELNKHTFEVHAGPESAEKIASLPSVKVVDAGPVPFLPLNPTGRRLAESDQAQLFWLDRPAPSYDGVTGLGVRIGIADSGVDGEHDDFDAITAAGDPGASRVYNPRPGSGGHGTHVASIAAGNGINADANGFPAFSMRGHAPEALIGDYAQMGATVANYFAAIVNDNTDVTNHSYVQSTNGYGTAAAILDEIVRGDADYKGNPVPARPQVWAAGNNGTVSQYGNEEGYYGLFTSAKNTISVGSVDTRDGRVSDFSSLGPTFDGRIKPDLVAPGCKDSIGAGTRISAARNGSQGYTDKCGTSMAAPAVSGIIALMMHSYKKAFLVFPKLYPSTYKALLVRTARDMIKTDAYADREFNNPDTGEAILFHSGPDFATGYGLVDADAAVRAIADSRLWKQATVGTTGEVDTYCVDAKSGAGEFKAVLAWDDEPGSTLTSLTTSKLVNDLDLELVSPSGTVIRPWTLDPLPVSATPGDGAVDPITTSDVVPARRGIDRRNNVEMANVPLPESGEWKVRVRAFSLPNANSQSYSLATSLPFKTVCNIGPIVIAPICQLYPWMCDGRWKWWPPKGGIDWRVPVPVNDICKYVIDCPGCERVGPNSYCPGWQVDIKGLPRDARVTVFDEVGRVFGTVRKGPNHTIKISERRPNSERFIFVSGPDGKPFKKFLTPRVRVIALEQ